MLKFVSLNKDEVPDVNMLKEMLSSKTKLVVVHHVSNVLGMFIRLKASLSLSLCCLSVSLLLYFVSNKLYDLLLSLKVCTKFLMLFIYSSFRILAQTYFKLQGNFDIDVCFNLFRSFCSSC